MASSTGIIQSSFLKTGFEGSCYGYENKYLRIGRALNKTHGCSVISSSNPLGYETDFAAEMEFVRDYARNQNLDSYQVYYFGHSNGASLGIINACQFAEIKKLVCINAPLMTNPHLLLCGIKNFSGEKMTLVYGSNDASFKMLKLYSELESDRIGFCLHCWVCVQSVLRRVRNTAMSLLLKAR